MKQLKTWLLENWDVVAILVFYIFVMTGENK